MALQAPPEGDCPVPLLSLSVKARSRPRPIHYLMESRGWSSSGLFEEASQGGFCPGDNHGGKPFVGWGLRGSPAPHMRGKGAHHVL